ncbi:MAG TPA: tyrosine--tRNA ligase, partial [Rhodospirillales bacterium]|nr:tyrosine--tRNA ligase [Rhodospirillales bacterium]
YDFLELARRHGCILQMGGSDQWGNIVGGVELARRVDRRSVFGLTTPLLTTASGAKMGKTAAGAVWLNAEMLSPYDYWQYWRNSEDGDVGRFLRLFTELPLPVIAQLEAREGAAINEAKVILADEATRLCHGEEARAQAAETAQLTFAGGAAGAALPSIEVTRAELDAGLSAVDAFRRVGLAASNSEVRRLVKAGGARINNVAVTDETRMITPADLNTDCVVKLSAGKKRHALVRLSE